MSDSTQSEISTDSTEYQRASEAVRRRRAERRQSGETERDADQLDLETAAGTKRLNEWGDDDA